MTLTPSASISIKLVENSAEWDSALQVRTRVFVQEQHVPIEHERDTIDEHARHLIAQIDGHTVGTARAFKKPDDPGTLWVGRLAVLPEVRGKGVGGALLDHLIAWGRAEQFSRVRMHAQTQAIRLYRRHGFTTFGEVFTEEGIEHQEMVLDL
ncbi:MAG: GNAT family N-acetyltransferase [Candidatus Ozemobacteraceae bacterium]